MCERLTDSINLVAPPADPPYCPICYLDWQEENGQVCATRCNHIFHLECLWKMFDKGTKQLLHRPEHRPNFHKCPMCRGQLISEEVCRIKDAITKCEPTGPNGEDIWRSPHLEYEPLTIPATTLSPPLNHADHLAQEHILSRLKDVKDLAAQNDLDQFKGKIMDIIAEVLRSFRQDFPRITPYVWDSTMACHITSLLCDILRASLSIEQWVVLCHLHRRFHTESIHYDKPENVLLIQRIHTRSHKWHIPTLLGRSEPRFIGIRSWQQYPGSEDFYTYHDDVPYFDIYHRLGHRGRCLVSVLNRSWLHITEIGLGTVTQIKVLKPDRKITVRTEQGRIIMEFSFEGETYLGPMVQMRVTSQR
ncbi:hypothetical protein P154DRAFT_574881 [Amniculicola lignicola CBS 123094]|uniref:RING-type domain-containing protein n=1 Tax=Amniculicola lignicola CBS 123094 TaxID=1392246 RepID=A0A6A5WI58_9PLEO|nr:hypothetical protein P154DRAFT_574881 [Amniculicola lignicola CBS 123094]